MILNDRTIRRHCTVPAYYEPHGGPMVEPFVEFWPYNDTPLPLGTISYGLTAGGYDIRLGGEVMVYKNTSGEVVNPKRFKDPDYVKRLFDLHHVKDGQEIIIPPGGYILGESVEYFRIPKHLIGQCLGKSTYARCAVTVNVTPLEPGWHGKLTVEVSNDGPCGVTVFAGEGIAQILFHVLSDAPEVTYADKRGKYQGQTGVTPPKVS